MFTQKIPYGADHILITENVNSGRGGTPLHFSKGSGLQVD